MKMSRGTLPLFIFLLSAISCATQMDIRKQEKGGPYNPVLCDGPEGERIYLRRLRGPKGEKIAFEYFDSVIGPEAKILDIFLIFNPNYESEDVGLFDRIFDAFRDEPDVPYHYRVYMNFYHPGKYDEEPIPGYSLEPFEK